jgi:hypothetical protein
MKRRNVEGCAVTTRGGMSFEVWKDGKLIHTKRTRGPRQLTENLARELVEESKRK